MFENSIFDVSVLVQANLIVTVDRWYNNFVQFKFKVFDFFDLFKLKHLDFRSLFLFLFICATLSGIGH